MVPNLMDHELAGIRPSWKSSASGGIRVLCWRSFLGPGQEPNAPFSRRDCPSDPTDHAAQEQRGPDREPQDDSCYQEELNEAAIREVHVWPGANPRDVWSDQDRQDPETGLEPEGQDNGSENGIGRDELPLPENRSVITNTCLAPAAYILRSRFRRCHSDTSVVLPIYDTRTCQQIKGPGRT